MINQLCLLFVMFLGSEIEAAKERYLEKPIIGLDKCGIS